LIIVAIIGLIGVVIKELYAKNKRPRKDPERRPQERESPETNKTQEPLFPPECTEHTNPNVQRTEIELQKIANSIMGTPAFSQEHVMAQYQDREIDWELELHSITQNSDGLEAILHVGGFTVFCPVSTKEANILKTAHEGDRFQVKGRIRNVQNKRVVHLTDCNFATARALLKGETPQQNTHKKTEHPKE